jgi:hypothetical protein
VEERQWPAMAVIAACALRAEPSEGEAERNEGGRGGRWEARPWPLPVTQDAAHAVASRARGSNGGLALGMTATHWARVGLRGISSTTWQAARWPRWDAILGLLWAGLDFGPLMKFEARSKLYDFPLGSKVIRAVD